MQARQAGPAQAALSEGTTFQLEISFAVLALLVLILVEDGRIVVFDFLRGNLRSMPDLVVSKAQLTDVRPSDGASEPRDFRRRDRAQHRTR